MNRNISNLLALCLALLPLSGTAQNTAPTWLDADVRAITYPQAEYYTGYSVVAVTANVTREKAIERAKRAAVGEVSEKVRVLVSSEKHSMDISISGSNMEEQLRSQFQSAINTVSQTEIVGCKVDTYYDGKNREIHVFAYVSRAELAAYYQNQISLYLNKVESALITASELAQKGVKIKARKQCEEVARHFATVAYAQDLLTAIDAQSGDATLQQQRSESLRNTLVQTLTDLENSIYVYVECSETVNGQTVVHMADRLPGLLTEQGCGCNFTGLQEEADYVVKVNAHLARCTDAPNNVTFCYAAATASVYNAHTQKTLMPKIPETKGGWTNRNRAKATEEAFDELAGKIVEKVIPMIKN
ncbi:MAG: hypothetical protein LBN98_05765 [Prevotellaceae bacterium]|jgi:hypothetical protein|nr:hypothetical protein [Prevotellaceae bacterium]